MVQTAEGRQETRESGLSTLTGHRDTRPAAAARVAALMAVSCLLQQSHLRLGRIEV